MADPLQPDPVPVALVTPDPLPVTVVGETAVKSGKSEAKQNQNIDPSKPATTTFEQNLTSAGQRNINVMWEGTQKNIALMVVAFALLVLSYLIVVPGITTELKLVALSTISNVLFAVTSVYFTRTNHTKTGGVGINESGR